jgi:hypothetical protein
MSNQIEKYQNLLMELKEIPLPEVDKTLFEICKFPKQRYEEICSRVLAFYFDVNEEHGLKDLFIKSFIELLNLKCSANDLIIDYKQRDWGRINILTEANAEGKRLDLLIYNHKVIIGIENKITASLNNPLEQYKNLLQKFAGHDKICKKIVLSVYPVQELKFLISTNTKYFGFINLLYKDFFAIVQANLGNYINGKNSKFVIYLTDFIKDILNINNTMDIEIKEFIKKNENEIEDLIGHFREYRAELGAEVLERIKILKYQIENKTSAKWWIYDEYDLGVNHLFTNKPNLGVEGQFHKTSGDYFGEFRIYISGWEGAFVEMEAIIESKYPEGLSKRENVNYGWKQIATLEKPSNEQIVNRLLEAYNSVVKILNDIDEVKL